MSRNLSRELRDYLPRLTHRPLKSLIERAADRIDILEGAIGLRRPSPTAEVVAGAPKEGVSDPAYAVECPCRGSGQCPLCNGLAAVIRVDCACHGTGACVIC